MFKRLSIVLPTYNEKDNLENSVNEILAEEKNNPNWIFEIIIADSHSSDGTAEIAKKLVSHNSKIHYIDVERGIGVGIIKGQLYALDKLHPDLMAQMDADGQVESNVIRLMIRYYEAGYDLIIGSRMIKGGKNNLSLSRKVFTFGASIFCKIVMGPWNIGEFTNSARAFTPSLFKKIDLNRLPWKERTFIIQPAFLHEAVISGAKYAEVPLVFKDRNEGYSKNKVANYIYDIIAYSIDARAHQLGINIPFFRASRKVKTFVKFGLVGVTGTTLDFTFYNLFILFLHLQPAVSKGFSSEIAIINNFTWNNKWTFRHRKTSTSLSRKFVTFNMVSLGGLLIAVLIVRMLHILYGDGTAQILGLHVAFYNLYFFATVPPVWSWNFVMNHLITWRHEK